MDRLHDKLVVSSYIADLVFGTLRTKGLKRNCEHRQQHEKEIARLYGEALLCQDVVRHCKMSHCRVALQHSGPRGYFETMGHF
jgi:hypothetical protein